MNAHQLSSLDLSNINLGAAKKSIIDFDSLKNVTKIGEGGFGIVFRANWRELNVAVKQIRAEHVNESQFMSFLSEVSLLQNLRSHPNVVLFIGLTIPPQPLSLITEFCEGGSLDTYIKAHEINEELIFKFVNGIALGILHLHSENVIHRDLAVRNILLNKHLEPKVADFGLSRINETQDTATTASNVGPLKWMSPESILSREYSTKSDTWSFGVVIWEILTRGTEPYDKLPPLEAAIAVAKDGLRLSPPDNTPKKLERLMNACWQKEPSDRPDFGLICAELNLDSSSSEHEPFNPDNSKSNADGSTNYQQIHVQ
eukprot:TRINITY_DN6655_c0_g1_i2.p1 TRINITY_DN6655_c0_g1~~TRINITY_DN6655_c0_g1_i2.p1  ORF type:complete len:357 (-),score=104.85 TRINITY_DN6655_c0_g1_i2:119-1060(-)